jgi:hypothetical protein
MFAAFNKPLATGFALVRQSNKQRDQRHMVNQGVG